MGFFKLKKKNNTDELNKEKHSLTKDQPSMNNNNAKELKSLLNKYKENEVMGQHADWNEHQDMLEYSFVVYINEDYEGGELYFKDLDVTITPEAGSIALFPAKLPYSHGSNQLISGRKVFIPHFWRNVKS